MKKINLNVFVVRRVTNKTEFLTDESLCCCLLPARLHDEASSVTWILDWFQRVVIIDERWRKLRGAFYLIPSVRRWLDDFIFGAELRQQPDLSTAESNN